MYRIKIFFLKVVNKGQSDILVDLGLEIYLIASLLWHISFNKNTSKPTYINNYDYIYNFLQSSYQIILISFGWAGLVIVIN